ncbi:MAG: alpha/beta hydrolase [Prochloraceae cyanobacterium]
MVRKIHHKSLKNPLKPQQFFWQHWISALTLGTIPAMFSLIPVNAAQTIDFTYGPLGFSIEVDSLELFAKEGKINRELDFYLSRVEPEARDKFRQALLRREADRQLDISYVLDELKKLNDTEFERRLNLKAVGVIGHSFGGYTALAIAGAQINLEQLEQDCDKIIWDPNLSLLVQCLALKLPRRTYDFLDRRVGAIFISNPICRSIFGVKGLSTIQIPVFMSAGELDPATPAAIEQILPFTFLTTSDRYLALVKGEVHVDISQLDAGATQAIESLSRLKLIDPDLSHKYDKAMVTAFFEYYIAKNTDYLPYLQSSYDQYLSEEPFPVYLLGDSSVEALEQAIEDFIAEEN